MHKKVFLLVLLSWLLSVQLVKAQDSFTQEDRERLIRLETTLKVFMDQVDKRFEQIAKRFEQVDKRFAELREDINKRFEQVDKRFEQMMTFLWILTAIFTTLVAVVIGFAYWDRRTIIKRAKEETIEQLEREGKLKDLIDALRELAREDSRLAEILRYYRLL
ncbi:hypothetical protein [Thermodesulfatator autotrophicus]|uniref:t-SNARE coiled-coil homology domain-containing protein n=1 Tax=Thermodesulfatator autotrophicus TaxID=1795632 RepID=A0A177E7R8_9BACT|nr:hypothetical protein [Thermodesulfatator autotrophicus]OAG27480.1 hypothetical protein TH606_06625 [Thermodesulfatator autotrophicus]